MSSSSSFVLDGVQFKISDAFLVHRIIELPPSFDLKDPEVLLEECEYDFSAEKHLIFLQEDRKRKLEEQKKLEQQEKERLKQELAEKHRQFLSEKEKMKIQQSNDDTKSSTNNVQGITISSNNPFLKDMVSSDILTPQKYTDVDKHDSPKKGKLDVHEFEIDNQDPFSNMELQTIDDIKELQDVLQNVTMSGMMDTTSTVTPNTRIRHHSPTNKDDEISTKLSKKNKDDASASKSSVIEELTDLLTDDVIYTENSPGNTPPLQKKTFDVTSSAPKSTSISKHLDNNSNFLPAISSGSLPSLDNSLNMQSQSSTSLSVNRPSSVPNMNIANDMLDSSNKRNYTTKYKDEKVLPPVERNSPTFNIKSENEYVNVPTASVPKVPPKPLPRTAANNLHDKNLQDNFTATQITNSTAKYGAVKKKVLANKSKAERDKFEETINKALTSLPQLPASVTRKKNTERSSSPQYMQASGTTPTSPGLIAGLTQDERNFVHSIVMMGFSEQDVIRTMQKHGENHKEVLDRLCILQRLSEKGFSKSNIEEALDLFNEDEQETEKYLVLQKQFLDMGFSNDKVKQALLLHNSDQSKALEDLMLEV